MGVARSSSKWLLMFGALLAGCSTTHESSLVEPGDGAAEAASGRCPATCVDYGESPPCTVPPRVCSCGYPGPGGVPAGCTPLQGGMPGLTAFCCASAGDARHASIGQACTTSADCVAPSQCMWRLGESCSAAGTCWEPMQSTAPCLPGLHCLCDGGIYGACNHDGYFPERVTADQSCFDSGADPRIRDAGQDADASADAAAE